MIERATDSHSQLWRGISVSGLGRTSYLIRIGKRGSSPGKGDGNMDYIQRMTNVRKKKKNIQIPRCWSGMGNIYDFYSIEYSVPPRPVVCFYQDRMRPEYNKKSNLIINAIDTIAMFLSESSILICALPGTLYSL